MDGQKAILPLKKIAVQRIANFHFFLQIICILPRHYPLIHFNKISSFGGSFWIISESCQLQTISKLDSERSYLAWSFKYTR